MTKYTLTYFNVRGRAEVTRLLFAQAGVEYEDKRVSHEEWQRLKPNTPSGALPVLEVDGKVLFGSGPIARFVAVTHGLAASNDLENAELDGVLDVGHDLMLRVMAVRHEKDETRKAELRKELEETHVPRYLGILEKRAAASNSAYGWIYSPRVTYADVTIFVILGYVSDAIPSILDKYPALAKLKRSVESLPNIAKWLAERPQTEI